MGRRFGVLVMCAACAVPRGALDVDANREDAGDTDGDAGEDAGFDASTDVAELDAMDAATDTGADAFDAGFDAAIDAGPPCVGVDPIVAWDFGGASPLDDIAPPAPRMNLTWRPVEGAFAGGAAVLAGTRLESERADSQALGEALRSSDRVSVHGWIHRPSTDTPTSPLRVFGCSRDLTNRAFTVGQTDDELVVRFKSTNIEDDNGRNVTTPFFPTSGPRHFAFTWDGRRVRIFVDGSEQVDDDHGGGADLVWTDMDLCLFGDEVVGERAWNGSVFSLAVYDIELGSSEVECLAGRPPM